MKRILSVLVEDKPGVLVRVAGLFSRRGFNIDSLAVGHTMEPGISRMTIQVQGEDNTFEQIVKQLHKLVNVIKISDLTDDPAVSRELLLVKVSAEPVNRSEIQQIVSTFRAKIIDISLDSMVVEITGDEGKLNAFLMLMQEFGIKEIVSTGKVALARGSKVTTRSAGGK